MTIIESGDVPAWLNIEAIHPAEELAKIPAIVEAARGVLEAVAAFNREHLATMHAYYERNESGPDDLRTVDEITGMHEADGYLLLAGYIIERTVVGQGTATSEFAARKLAEHADLVHGVRGLYLDRFCPLPLVSDGTQVSAT